MLINFRLCETESESECVSETETMRLESGSAMSMTGPEECNWNGSKTEYCTSNYKQYVCIILYKL